MTYSCRLLQAVVLHSLGNTCSGNIMSILWAIVRSKLIKLPPTIHESGRLGWLQGVSSMGSHPKLAPPHLSFEGDTIYFATPKCRNLGTPGTCRPTGYWQLALWRQQTSSGSKLWAGRCCCPSITPPARCQKTGKSMRFEMFWIYFFRFIRTAANAVWDRLAISGSQDVSRGACRMSSDHRVWCMLRARDDSVVCCYPKNRRGGDDVCHATGPAESLCSYSWWA